MTPLPPSEERPLWAVGARRLRPGAPSVGEIVPRLRALASESEALVALLDARGVAGERHLLSAWAHLGRARSRGETRLRDRGAEFLLYVAGEAQLPRALAKVGVGPETEAFVLVGERPRTPDALLGEFGLVAAPDVYPRAPDASVLARLGIGTTEREAVPPSAWEALVLERVALLELEPAHGGPPAAAPGGPAPGAGPTRGRKA